MDVSAATQFSSTGADTTQFTGFLPGSYLAHFNTDLEFIGHNLYELSEINTILGSVIENSFRSISLKLHIIEFHVKIQLFNN
ncbi:hypothetical protein SDC9_125849 [bioreactor metagenome]|uniref:Uncharacterized protein n=1 Tax=bioreactor metagenome TaxID=1076179 RepID=A0A645CPN4_9ZZZZ